MSDLHTLPDRPVFAFCPACEPAGEPQPIRLVFAGVPGYVPIALDDAERLFDRRSTHGSGSIADRGPRSSNDTDSTGTTAFTKIQPDYAQSSASVEDTTSGRLRMPAGEHETTVQPAGKAVTPRLSPGLRDPATGN